MAHSISTSSTGESPSPVILKRKRTKRCRTLPPPPATAAASSASSNTTEEEQDMANCLILLAQGRSFPVNEAATPGPSVPAAPADRTGLLLYVCKTCDKRFPSFQALGGHRASHKKPKLTASETELQTSMAKPMASSSSGAGKQRTHECSICGVEFLSGQALGGHMRRHRSAVLLENNTGTTNKKKNRVLMLDLNLPAPADDEPFLDEPSLVLSPPVAPPALVNCQY